MAIIQIITEIVVPDDTDEKVLDSIQEYLEVVLEDFTQVSPNTISDILSWRWGYIEVPTIQPSMDQEAQIFNSGS